MNGITFRDKVRSPVMHEGLGVEPLLLCIEKETVVVSGRHGAHIDIKGVLSPFYPFVKSVL